MNRHRPNVTVACVIQAGDRFLLVEEAIDGQLRFNQPAGHLEAGESLAAACAREVFEETGLALQPERLVRVHQWAAPSGTEFLRFSFGIHLTEPLATAPRDPQILACHWLTLAQIRALGPALRSPLVVSAIEDHLADSGAPLSLFDNRLP
ncbi:NUDIX hydrolase [Ferrimonas balearica]|uniref:NUDIX hydrolase n=1 Tax=Ferrimonas balearica TaxID=44012 RepID=UPI001C9A19CC|nr:NUDIX hydrolase [Ferrimonas balearica]MBY5991694.1 NUDIX hydrolase [Ferrimonas balearica]